MEGPKRECIQVPITISSNGLSGYENEVINLLSRIEKNVVAPKPSVLRTPQAVRTQKTMGAYKA